jgi:hypothetical protein
MSEYEEQTTAQHKQRIIEIIDQLDLRLLTNLLQQAEDWLEYQQDEQSNDVAQGS